MSNEGIVFDIQRCSVFDGPGIRTTVFLKGCPLRCKWCHNPESQNITPDVMFFEEKCLLCGKCVEFCPTNSHKIINQKHIFNGHTCEKCYQCIPNCPTQAIIIKGQKMSVDDIIEVVIKDKDYYDMSGGGLTISGGEPLFQLEFTIELLRKAKEYNINTCVETSGFTKKEKLEKVIPYVDIFLYDYKVTDPSIHEELTGVDNKMILENLEYLYDNDCKIILRCPLIHGINDDIFHLKAIANIRKKYPKILNIEILPYHNIGVSKLKRLGFSYKETEFKVADEETKKYWNEIVFSK